MNCQKCGKLAVVHLTDLVSSAGGPKKLLEVHLCIEHAREAGMLVTGLGGPGGPGGQGGQGGAGDLSDVGNVEPAKMKAPQLKPVPPQNLPEGVEMGEPVAGPQPPVGGLAVVRRGPQAIQPVEKCPHCGMTWQQFKQHGVMGCPKDYELFGGRLTALIRRAQENAVEHTGKVPLKVQATPPGRAVTAARLRRELERALDCEKYEEAARLRDQIREFEN
jgi:protein-arginine kinase activator protein McsA